MWSLVPLWLALSGAVASLRCPDGQLCQGFDVCCRDPGGDGYACCPPPLGSPHSLPMTQASSVAEPAGTVCPDGTQCPAEYSCLRTPAGSFSCCPLSEAVACADRHHCCPRGSHCSADGRSCFVLPGLPAAGAVQCPDGESECPNESTCCMMPTGSWGCCPMPQAACCTDKVHCCPHATTCDLEHARCLSATGAQPLGSKVPARKRAPWQGVPVSLGVITCPDHKSVCQDGTTCCQLPTSQYGCCPLQNAVCCSDRLHCCPKGTTCDLQHSKCASTLGQLQPLTRLLDASERAREVRCDEQTSCPDGSTCCRRSTGAWACCPLVEAVCCQDHVHCCPKGYTCDLAGGRCQPPAVSIPWLEKTPARVRAPSRGRDVQCDEQTSCPDGNTCCRLSTGAWGCCPLVEAVCCQDHVHCCPKGYTCNPAGGCQQALLSVPWLEKTPARVRAPSRGRDVQCDEQTSCPDGNTCCRLSTGAWGCCPLVEAVCCQDHVHCCPKGYTCNPAGGCQQALLSVPWLEKTPARVRAPSRGRDVQCDEQTSCPDGNTCCRLSTGAWGCCPLVEAVCCQDHVHCCPKGYTCNPAGGCQQALLSVPWAPKAPAHIIGAAQSRGVKCNQTVSCEDGQTCCKSEMGSWACCHLPNAVCCEDHQHCCPWGYTCNLATQSCEKHQAGRVLPVGLSLSASLLPASPEPSNDVTCDAQHYCHAHQTCCKAATGAWACCPYHWGSCCSDKRHCCPWGYRCSKSGLDCKLRWPLRWDTGAPQAHRLL
ncbi:progranulin [Mauremys reevesii]|uniref:progranulin n=1 Tax=Mauremys reevesii TaxID=260615 RepID=UPI00193F4631|nr:progranulin [Mauremys reevesii]XP_039360101.1 progranulin [Mauremys reevesii]XP_039360102.1 progranulin [Mauremys reevesii]XP_039360103.1 progranulin [Mauremys reevesii]XP_039360104.1 progranulin [Mauremys reevesii]